MSELWNHVMEQFRKMRIMSFCFAVILILLGVFLLLRPGAAIRLICFMIGLCLLLYGIFLTAEYLAEAFHDHEFPPLPFRLIGGVLLLVIGILIIRHPEGIISFASVILAVILFAFAADSFFETRLAWNYQDSRWWLRLISAVVTSVLGLVLVFAPIRSAEVVMRLAGAAMIYTGAAMLISNIRLVRFINNSSSSADRRGPDIIDGEATEMPDDDENAGTEKDPEILEGEVVDEEDDGPRFW